MEILWYELMNYEKWLNKVRLVELICWFKAVEQGLTGLTTSLSFIKSNSVLHSSFISNLRNISNQNYVYVHYNFKTKLVIIKM